MKWFLGSSIVFMVSLCSPLRAQWSTTPGTPLRLTNDTHPKIGPLMTEDGQGGSYVVWIDDGPLNQIMGQHLDADGYELWNAGGIALESGSNIYFELAPTIACLPGGDLLLCWTYTFDSVNLFLLMQRFAPDGTAVWSQPAEVGGFGGIYVDARFMSFMVNGPHIFVAYDCWTGQTVDLRLSRVEFDGTVSWGYNGILVEDSTSLGFQVLPLMSDGGDGGYYIWPTNVQVPVPGQLIAAQRFRADGTFVWQEPVIVNDDPPVDIANNWLSLAPLGASDVAVAWKPGYSGPVKITRLDSTGAHPWPVAIDTVFATSPDGRYLQIFSEGEEVVISWVDYVAPYTTPQFFAQRYDAAGNELWPSNGLGIMTGGDHYPWHMSSLWAPGKTLIFTGSGGDGYAVQRIANDGTLELATPLILIDTAFTSLAYAQSMSRVRSGNALIGAVNFYRHDAGRDIAVYRVADTDFPTDIQADSRSVDPTVYPVPADHWCTVHWNDGPPAGPLAVFLYDASGRRFPAQVVRDATADLVVALTSLASGPYLLELLGNERTWRSRLVVEH